MPNTPPNGMPPKGNSSTQVKFNEPGMDYARASRAPRQSSLTQFVVKLGLAKDAKQATVVLVVLGVVAAVGVYIFWPSGSDYEVVPQPGLEESN